MSAGSETYKKLKKLGEGSYGKALLCQCTTDKTLVVVKQMDLTEMTSKQI